MHVTTHHQKGEHNVLSTTTKIVIAAIFLTLPCVAEAIVPPDTISDYSSAVQAQQQITQQITQAQQQTQTQITQQIAQAQQKIGQQTQQQIAQAQQQIAQQINQARTQAAQQLTQQFYHALPPIEQMSAMAAAIANAAAATGGLAGNNAVALAGAEVDLQPAAGIMFVHRFTRHFDVDVSAAAAPQGEQAGGGVGFSW